MKRHSLMIFAVVTALVFSSFSAIAGGPDPLFLVKVNGKYGYIDKTGKMIIEPQFDDAMDFNDGMAAVQIGDKWGYINTNGKIAIKPQYVFTSSFYDDCACVSIESEKYFIIDKKGNTLFRIGDNWTINRPSEGLIAVRFNSNGKWGYIDKNGEIAIEQKYDKAWGFSEGLAPVVINNKTGYIDMKGNMVISPIYDYAGFFSEGLAIVEIDNKYGFIDKSGKIVIKAQYDDVLGFKEGLALVKIGDKWGYIDKKGKMAIKPQFYFAMYFCDGLALVESDDNGGYIDKTGKMVIEADVEDAYNFSNGLARINLNDFESAYIDKKGKTVFVFENDKPNYDFNEEEDIEEIPDEDATFPGGEDALYEFLGSNIQYPELARNNNVTGTVVVKFIVEKDGSITNASILRDIGGGCGKEVLRVINAMPKWIPAKKYGKRVRSFFTLPVQFELKYEPEQEDETEQQ
ncbi:MAG: TonB family protein [Bacteroidales bacterium]|nr:TonB family protein [Bacteroidales bacterium]